MKIKLVCFDVDGTLVNGVSWQFLTEGLRCSFQEHMDIFDRARSGELSFTEAEKKLTKMYQDSGRATKVFIQKLFAKIQPRKEAKKIISSLKNKGYHVFLISGAIDLYVAEIAKKLKVDGYYANSTLEFNKRGVLTKIHYREDQGKVKVKQLKELMGKFRLKKEEVVFIGDSWNDIEVFKYTRRGIAVHCFNEELKKVAWKTIDSLVETESLEETAEIIAIPGAKQSILKGFKQAKKEKSYCHNSPARSI